MNAPKARDPTKDELIQKYTAYHRKGDGVEATKQLYSKLPDYKR